MGEHIHEGEMDIVRCPQCMMGTSDELHSTNVPGVFARNAYLTPYRGCCTTLEGSAHLSGCGVHYFAKGQTVIEPDCNPMDPWGPARLHICEDTVSSDRTFENEMKLHKRSPRQHSPRRWSANDDDWLF